MIRSYPEEVIPMCASYMDTDDSLYSRYVPDCHQITSHGPEDPQTPPVPLTNEDEREALCRDNAHDPDYVPEPVYPEYIPLEMNMEDPEEYEDDETKDGPVDYPMDGGDDGDDDDGDSSGDDADDKDEEDKEITIRPQASISLPPEAEVERLLAMTTPSPSPPISLSPPSAGERLARDTWIDPAEVVPEVAPMTVGEVNTRVTELAELHEHDTQDLYALLEDAQDRDSIDGEGGGLCFPRGFGSLDRMSLNHPSGAFDPTDPMLYAHRHHIKAAHQAHLQLQSTLIQTHPPQEGRAKTPRPDARINSSPGCWGC
ncbi:hypothetical protein Tco_1182911 [Tanacetum coccineum]